MNLIYNENIKKEDWQVLLNKSLFASPFQTPDFFNFYNSIKNFSADVFAVEENGNLLSLAIITIQKEHGIKRYFSRRGIIYGGPLILNNNTRALSFLLNSIQKYYSKKIIYLESRNYNDYSNYNEQFKDTGFRYIPWLNFHQKIETPEQMLKSMSSSRKRQIKKAIKNGVIWEEAINETEVSKFYEILKELYETKIKKPLFPKEFFIKFFNQEIGKFLLVKYEKEIKGGIMCPIIEKQAIYEYFVCGLDKDFKNQYPSVMATWAAMEYASKNKIPLFDFMGAGKPDETYGVREFKSRFGGKQVEHGRYLKILNPLLYKIGVIGINILTKIKK